MYDELVKSLRICSRCDFGQNCNGCKQKSDDAFCCDKLLHEAADAIEDLEFACNRYEKDYKDLCAYLPKWIPVTERLPEEYVNVLCHLRSLDRQSEYYSIDHLMEDGQWWKAANTWKFEVTHWMPLPQTPKDGES